MSLLIFSWSSQAQKNQKEKNYDLFILTGKVVEADIFSSAQKPASEVQVVIYQNREIYVAFYTMKNGDYEFHLPFGFEYEVWFGGSAFVNKKVYVDARGIKPGRGESEIILDIGLFRPMDNYSFEVLNEPYVKFAWDPDYKQFAPQMDYTDQKAKELEKILKKIRKSANARS
jgi:hypothetical protein